MNKRPRELLAPNMMRMGSPYRRWVDPGTKLSRGVVRRVWGFTRRYRAQVAGFLATILASSLVAAAPPLLFRELIDRGIPQRDLGLVNLLALAAVALALVSAALSMVERWLSARIGEGLIYDLRTALFDHVQRQPLAFFTHTQTGALTSRLNTDVVGAQRALTGTLGSVTSNAVSLVTTLAVMVALDWRITLLTLGVLPLFLLPARRVGRALQRLTREAMQLNADMNATMNERFNVGGALVVMLFGRRAEELANFAQQAGKVRDVGVRTALYGRSLMAALGLVGALGTVAVYWLGARLVLSGALSLGTVVAFAAYTAQLYQPLIALTNARVDVLTAFVSFERVFEVLDHPPAIASAPGARPLANPKGRIEFDRVRFAYPPATAATIRSLMGEAGLAPGGAGEELVLHDVSFRVEPGEMVALVGPSGAGKTTIAMLVPRIWDVTGGAVRVDGYDVRDLELESLRSAIGVVTQDPHLFHDTILANLRYARPGATMEEVRAACRAARIDELVESLPEGYRTVVGERGYRLSGGEKQRLALARLILADPAIVILDEATAHLDSENEAQVQAALSELLAGRTSLVIAHRLSTVVNADRILVVDGGRVVEQGTHGELLAAGGLYAELYATQFGRAPASPGPSRASVGAG